MCNSAIRTLAICSMLFIPLSCTAESTTDNVYMDGITLTITNKPFVASAHKVFYCAEKSDYPLKPCTIDGKLFYGGNGELPKTEVKSLVFSKNGKKVYLDTSSIFDTGVTNSNIKKHISIEPWSDAYRVVGYFGVNQEPYIVHWLVLPEGGSVRNHLSDYESLVSLLYKVNKDFNIEE